MTGRKFADGIITVIRVKKLSMPGTGGEPVGSPFAFREERRCPKNSLPTSSRWRSSEAPASQSRTKGLAAGSLRTSAISRSWTDASRFSATRAPGYTAKAPLLGHPGALLVRRRVQGDNARCATQGRGEDQVGGGLRVLRCIWRVPEQVPRKSLIYFDYVY